MGARVGQGPEEMEGLEKASDSWGGTGEDESADPQGSTPSCGRWLGLVITPKWTPSPQ